MQNRRTGGCLAAVWLGALVASMIPTTARCAQAPALEITPSIANFGQEVAIRLSGFPPKQPVTLRARCTNELHHAWESHAVFLTDERGRVDLAKQAPMSGSYQTVDKSGLFWSMSLPDGGTIPISAWSDYLGSYHIYVSAEFDGRTMAAAGLERRLLRPGEKSIAVHDGKLRGTLFLPRGRGPHPVVIVLGGSEGGLHETEAAYVASQGYAALALAYFGYDDLPKSLENIPLEYFQSAITWLQSRPDIQANEIAVMGSSRGGELALLLGSEFPQLIAVVAWAPSGINWGSPSGNLPAWIFHGQPLPYMNNDEVRPEEWKQLDKMMQNPPVTLTPWFKMMLTHKAAVEKATIPVEKINGPVLLVSGNDDHLWPASYFSDQVMARLKRDRRPFFDRHLAYDQVGHFIPIPDYPATVNAVLIGDVNTELALGGQPKETAAAARDSWKRVDIFLRAAFENAGRKTVVIPSFQPGLPRQQITP